MVHVAMRMSGTTLPALIQGAGRIFSSCRLLTGHLSAHLSTFSKQKVTPPRLRQNVRKRQDTSKNARNGRDLENCCPAPPPPNPHNLISGEELTNSILSFCRTEDSHHQPTVAVRNSTQLADAVSIITLPLTTFYANGITSCSVRVQCGVIRSYEL